jgi:hypothetical protein
VTTKSCHVTSRDRRHSDRKASNFGRATSRDRISLFVKTDLKCYLHKTQISCRPMSRDMITNNRIVVARHKATWNSCKYPFKRSHLVPDVPVAVGFEQDARQLASAHGRRDVEGRVAILRKKNFLCQGCQIFLGTIYQNVEKYSLLLQNIPNGRKIYQMSVK